MRIEHIGDATMILGDCMDYMAGLPDKAFELAIVDPPYGINVNMNAGRKKSDASPKRDKKQWDDKTPDGKYFSELFRVSKKSDYLGRKLLYFTTYRCVGILG